MEKELLHVMDKIICLSNQTLNLLHQDYLIEKEKMVVISNGLFNVANTTTSISHLLENWHLTTKEKVILFVGRLNEVKGLSYLIKSFREILKKEPNCRLMIAGSGDFDTYLYETKDICTKITYTGLLNQSELYELYTIADIGVLPSLFETFGYVAVEMMMHKLPIVVTATSGLNELVEDGVSGLKVPIFEYLDKVEIDTDVLAEKIVYLLQHPAKAKRLGENAYKRYLSHYSSNIFRENMLEFYQSLC